MKNIAVVILMLMSGGCAGIIGHTASRHRDWEFMESVGGLAIGGQDKNSNRLIIRGDVSGLSQYSAKPTAINSGLSVMKIGKRVMGDVLQIYIITTLASEKHPNSVIHGVNIAGIKKGKYKVQYLNPDGSSIDLKEIRIY